jgi:metal-sulfur cluster biosynthetic enzyme
MTVSREQVTEALREVFDPELGMSVVDLGLIYGVEIEAGRVHVEMTLTTQGCPLHGSMTEWVRQAVGRVPGVVDVTVALTFEPPWTPDRIGPGARR